MIKKLHPLQMPSFYMILHSKIWQQLRWDPDNSRDKDQTQVTNDSQAYSPVLTVLLQKEAMGSKGESCSTNNQKWYWWKTSFENWFTNICNYLLLKFYHAKYLRGTKEFLSASKQVWEKSRANMQHMGIAKTRCPQSGCINMEYVCVNPHLRR